MSTPLRVAIYVRISNDRTGAGLGVARQEEECRTLAARIGWEIYDVYSDNDVSAYSGKTRPNYARLLADVAAGRVQAIIAWHADRLHRSPRELEDFIELVDKHHVRISTVKAGQLDLDTSSGKMVARILGSVARAESEQKSERLKSKLLQLAKSGKYGGGGSRPYGYEKDGITVRPAEAQTIQECARRVLAGEAIASVAKDLNVRGVPTATNRPNGWSVPILKRMLISPRIAGLREHRPRNPDGTRPNVGEIMAVAEWPAIIKREEMTRLHGILLDPARRVSPGRNGRYPLSGVLYCGREGCARRLVGRPDGLGRRRYVCNAVPGAGGCGKIMALSEPIEEHLFTLVAGALDDQPFMTRLMSAGSDVTADKVLAEIADDEAELEALAGDLGERRITRKEWLAARVPIEARLRQNRARLEKSDHRAPLTFADAPKSGEQALAWLTNPEIPASRKSAYIRAVMEKVWVLPGVRGRNKFDAARFKIDWVA
uniref:recombinase family protein n=1 Tax=Herbidospora sakaeratensis TaxID=564415 RepID=UPI0007830634|nr:recombinase family protein [Herbidospora sakaeratensis]